jgi:predicted metalloprotease with PDZ domain
MPKARSNQDLKHLLFMEDTMYKKLLCAFVVALVFCGIVTRKANAVEEKKVIKIKYSDEGNGAWLGVQILDLDLKMKKDLDSEAHYGAVVDDVLDDTPAAKAGLEPGDVIVKVDDKIVRRADDLTLELAQRKPDEKVTLDVIRGKETKTVTVTLGERPKEKSFDVFVNGPKLRMLCNINESNFGMEVKELDDNLASYFKVKSDEGVLVVAVEKDSPAGKAGALAGDVIVTVKGEKVSKVEDLNDCCEEADKGDEIAIQVIRHGEKKDLTLKIEEKPNHKVLSYTGQSYPLENFEIDKEFVGSRYDNMARMKEKMKDWQEDYEKEIQEKIKSESEKSMFTTQSEMEKLKQEMKRLQEEVESLKLKIK